jgi:hypothetical protein
MQIETRCHVSFEKLPLAHFYGRFSLLHRCEDVRAAVMVTEFVWQATQ